MQALPLAGSLLGVAGMSIPENMVDSRIASTTLQLPHYWFADRAMRAKLRIPHYLIVGVVRYRLSELVVWASRANVRKTPLNEEAP